MNADIYPGMQGDGIPSKAWDNVLPELWWSRLQLLPHAQNKAMESFWCTVQGAKECLRHLEAARGALASGEADKVDDYFIAAVASLHQHLQRCHTFVEQVVLIVAISVALRGGIPIFSKQLGVGNTKSVATVGIEWWMHRRPNDEYMGMHFDKDEVIQVRKEGAGPAKNSLQFSFPQISSVFYISDHGGPTIVADQFLRCQPLQTSQDSTSMCDSDARAMGWTITPSRPPSGCECPLMPNRYFIFDGAKLHGVKADDPVFEAVTERQSAVSSRECTKATRASGDDCLPLVRRVRKPDRVTLMLNFWNHRVADPSCIDSTGRTASGGIYPSARHLVQYGRPFSQRAAFAAVVAHMLQPYTSNPASCRGSDVANACPSDGSSSLSVDSDGPRLRKRQRKLNLLPRSAGASSTTPSEPTLDSIVDVTTQLHWFGPEISKRYYCPESADTVGSAGSDGGAARPTP
eukprot:INCI13168.1.p1 GENE.INCI13168.1~~INCI13168.1.p1  ORF type:complete len:461 (+),score=75.74 INCI13168.1:206-1588(+)